MRTRPMTLLAAAFLLTLMPPVSADDGPGDEWCSGWTILPFPTLVSADGYKYFGSFLPDGTKWLFNGISDDPAVCKNGEPTNTPDPPFSKKVEAIKDCLVGQPLDPTQCEIP